MSNWESFTYSPKKIIKSKVLKPHSLLLITLLIFSFSYIPFSAPRSKVVVSVNPSEKLGVFSRLLYGVNHRYHLNGVGCWDGRRNAPRDTVWMCALETGITFFRFPGGTVGTTYHWTDGVGPPARREKSVSGFDGRPLNNTYGFDEHMYFVESLNASTSVVVNFGSGTPEEAAAWVAYANGDPDDNRVIGRDILGRDWMTVGYWARLREENQQRMGVPPHPYNIIYWELGNEIFGSWEFSWTHSVEKYAFGGVETHLNEPVVKARNWMETSSISDGTPNQIFYVRYPPIVEGSLKLSVDGREWLPVENLSPYGPEDKVFTINWTTGEIRFGDNRNGAIPPNGSAIRVSYDCHHQGFVDFYQKMKMVDENIKVGSCFGSVKFIRLMGEEHPYDFLVIHSYHKVHASDPRKGYAESLVAPLILRESLETLREALERFAGDRADDVEIVVSEYNFNPQEGSSEHFGHSLARAIYVGCMLKMFIEENVSAANLHCFTTPGIRGRWGSAILSPVPNVMRLPASYTLELFSRYLEPILISVNAENIPQVDVEYNGRDHSTSYSVSLFEVLGSRNEEGDIISLLLINKDIENAMDCELRIDGIEGEWMGATYTLTADNVSSFNSMEVLEKPREQSLYLNNMRLLPFPVDFIIGSLDVEVDPTRMYAVSIEEEYLGEVGGLIQLSLPPHSITVLRLSKESAPQPLRRICRVEFYWDGELKYVDTEESYMWSLDFTEFGIHTLKILVVANCSKISIERTLLIVNWKR